MPDSVTERLKQAIADSDMSIKELAEASGVPYRTIQGYLSGEREPGAKNLSSILAHLSISAEWILLGKKPNTELLDTARLDLKEFALVPLYDMQVSAGGGAEVTCEVVKTQMAFRRSWLANMGLHVKDLALFIVAGDSMEPTICQGDIILINRSGVVPREEGIFLIRQDNALLIKHIQPLPGGEWMIISKNTTYLPYKVRPGDPYFAVLGQVIWFGRKLAPTI